jgi:hypothetical protein
MNLGKDLFTVGCRGENIINKRRGGKLSVSNCCYCCKCTLCQKRIDNYVKSLNSIENKIMLLISTPTSHESMSDSASIGHISTEPLSDSVATIPVNHESTSDSVSTVPLSCELPIDSATIVSKGHESISDSAISLLGDHFDILS